MADAHRFARDLVAQLQTLPADAARRELPAYDYRDAPRATAQLASHSVPRSFRLGTGASVFASALLPALLQARHEILFVTCFWAPSKSLRDLADALRRLAEARTAAHRSASSLRIRICLSSRSLLQKLLHTASRDGHVYPPATWSAQLGLPPADVLEAAGIDMSVKSLFFLPFSIMHPKYVVVDRARAFLPSCNVSWEPWLEDCVELTGDAVGPLLTFYGRTWRDDLPAWPNEDEADADADADAAALSVAPATTPGDVEISPLDVDGPGSVVVRFPAAASPVPTLVLPSSHHRNPRFHPFPWQDYAPPPATPLNLAMLQLFATATRDIYVHSPNLTTEAVLVALLDALGRGVDVSIVTGEGMMVYEQILTAFTTTARCVRSLVKRYATLQAAAAKEDRPCGSLRVDYYQPLSAGRHGSRTAASSAPPSADEEQAILSGSHRTPPVAKTTNSSGFVVDAEEPVHSHVKLTIVDGAHTVLGSGNMDRASFFTSQELGILFHDAGFAATVQTAIDRVLEGRLKPVYPRNSL